MQSNHSIPMLGLGTWQLTGRTCVEAVKAALKLGYNHIDTAEIYGNQKEISRAINGVERKELFITSKVWRDNLSYDDTIESAERTLKELGISYLDLLLIHWPNKSIPVKETLQAFKQLVEEDKTNSVGVSNFTIRHLREALDVSKIPISVNQVEFHPYLYQRELLDFCKKNKILLTAYSPLGQGKIFGNAIIAGIAKKNSRTPAQVCLNWALQKGTVVIPRSSSESHLKENLDTLGWKLPEEDIRKIDSLSISRRIVNPGFAVFD